MGAVEDKVKSATGAVGDITDAALVVEDNLVGEDLTVFNDESVEFLGFESTGE